MPHAPTADALFFARTDLDRSRATAAVGEALAGADDGELFLEYRQTEALEFDDGRLKTASYDVSQGLGLRRVVGEAAAYAHASTLSQAALSRAARTVAGLAGGTARLAEAPPATNRRLYGEDSPLDEMAFDDKVRLLQRIDSYLRGRDERVRQVRATISGSWQAVSILRADGSLASDIRPLVRIDIACAVEVAGRMESARQGRGARALYRDFVAEDSWRPLADEVLAEALANLEAVAAPAGEMPVVLGPGWPGILLHEAVGHGLEGDFNRKKTSAFAGLMGERIAAPGVTVVDDGTLDERRGSLTIDDEGTPTAATVLIEDGILKGYMHDRMNARLLGHAPTGNGRRQSYAHRPMPRMTNTFMLAGEREADEIVASVAKGLYAAQFGGGQVDITNGKFSFSATQAYRIENGSIGAPVKGATLIGNGPDILTRVSAVGNDMALDGGVGNCGKDGQIVPVGVGQPTILIEGLTVGGTRAG